MRDNFENRYVALVEEILDEGIERRTRNSVTKSLFGKMLKIKMQGNDFPILQGRKMYYKGVIGELSAFLKGPKNLKDFEKEGCNFWSKWAREDGSIDVDYGNAWLDFNGVNQLDELVNGLKDDPYGRRHIVTGWRPDRVKSLSLPCCHTFYQWYVRDEGAKRYLDMVWYQRSVDTMIGLPSNIISAYTWNILVANDVNMIPGEITMMLGDTHIYKSHYEGAKEYIKAVHLLNEVGEVNAKYSINSNMGMKNFNPNLIDVYNYYPLSPIQFELIA